MLTLIAAAVAAIGAGQYARARMRQHADDRARATRARGRLRREIDHLQ